MMLLTVDYPKVLGGWVDVLFYDDVVVETKK